MNPQDAARAVDLVRKIRDLSQLPTQPKPFFQGAPMQNMEVMPPLEERWKNNPMYLEPTYKLDPKYADPSFKGQYKSDAYIRDDEAMKRNSERALNIVMNISGGMQKLGIPKLKIGNTGAGNSILNPNAVEGNIGQPLRKSISISNESPNLVKPLEAAQPLSQEAGFIRQAKGLSAEDIMAKHPDIQLKRDVPITDIYGNKVKIPEGEALTPYELKGNKVLLKDGETYIVSKNQYQNIKGNAIKGEAKPFAPELAGTEETIIRQ